MSKFHINKKGVPAPCHAQQGKCPLGGDSGEEGHYNSVEEAQVEADRRNSEGHDLLPNMPKENKVVIYDMHGYEKELIGKQVTLITSVIKRDGSKETLSGEVVAINLDRIRLKTEDGSTKMFYSHRIEKFEVESTDENPFVEKSTETINAEKTAEFEAEQARIEESIKRNSKGVKPSPGFNRTPDIKNAIHHRSPKEGFATDLVGHRVELNLSKKTGKLYEDFTNDLGRLGGVCLKSDESSMTVAVKDGNITRKFKVNSDAVKEFYSRKD